MTTKIASSFAKSGKRGRAEVRKGSNRQDAKSAKENIRSSVLGALGALAVRWPYSPYVNTRPHVLFVPQIPLRKHSSCTIWL